MTFKKIIEEKSNEWSLKTGRSAKELKKQFLDAYNKLPKSTKKKLSKVPKASLIPTFLSALITFGTPISPILLGLLAVEGIVVKKQQSKKRLKEVV